AEKGGDAKVASENFKDLKLRVIRSTKEEDKDDPPIVWTNQGPTFYLGTDVDALKDFISHADGRDDSLADSESYGLVKKKVGEDAQASWYFDVSQALKLAARVGGAQGGNAQQIETILQITGLNGLKAGGGSLAFNVGNYDTLSRNYFLSPGPAQGL